jgi:hypothetical protein
MAKLLADFSRTPELGDQIKFLVDGEEHTGEIVRIGNTRTWGHVVSDLDGRRYEWTSDEVGFEVL